MNWLRKKLARYQEIYRLVHGSGDPLSLRLHRPSFEEVVCARSNPKSSWSRDVLRRAR